MFNPAHTTSERNMGTSLYWVVTSNHMSEKESICSVCTLQSYKILI